MSEDFSKINYPRAIEKIMGEYNNSVLTLNKVDNKLKFEKPQFDVNTGESVSARSDIIDPEHIRLDIVKRKEILTELEVFYKKVTS